MDSKILKINNNDTYTIQYTGQQLEYALGKILGLQLVNNNSSVDITLNNITYTLIKKEYLDEVMNQLGERIMALEGTLTIPQSI